MFVVTQFGISSWLDLYFDCCLFWCQFSVQWIFWLLGVYWIIRSISDREKNIIFQFRLMKKKKKKDFLSPATYEYLVIPFATFLSFVVLICKNIVL